jgi:hypothetical protein
MAVMAAAPGSWPAEDELADAELVAGELAAGEVAAGDLAATDEDAAAFTAPVLPEGLAFPARKATVPTTASTTTAATAISQTRFGER